MYILLIILPLFGALISLLFGNQIGGAGAIIFTTTLAIFNFLISIFVFYEVALCKSSCFLDIGVWFDVGYCIANWGGFFDSLTVVMLLIITFISMLVHVYSISYMDGDPHIIRFMSFLSLFTFFMIVLVTGDNLIQLFVGWEGVGLCSYLLINFWHTRLQANKAAIKAMLVNRVGDIGLVLAILVAVLVFKSVNYSLIFTVCPLYTNTFLNFLNFSFLSIDLLAFFLFFGAVGKSAQLGLHTWLPDAMEGPTPVSALIHAATMVTAGVFLIARCSPIFEHSPTVLLIITFIGSITALFGATTALFQNDIKKVIAYSTCSQLGYMFLICGLSHYSLGVFHLFNHAFFKALLFLGAGSIIHSTSDEQDFRRMGGLRKLLPFSYAVMVIGSLSLIGFPFLTGFYSKDAILELAFAKYSTIGHFAYSIGVLTAFFTAVYSVRLIFLVFLSPTNSYYKVIKNVHEASVFIFIPLIFLIFGSIFVGFFFKDMFIGLGTPFWGNSIYILPTNYRLVDGEFLPTYIKLLPSFFVLIGSLFSYYGCYYYSNLLLDFKLKYIIFYKFFNKKWFFDKIINTVFVQQFLTLCFSSFYVKIDKGLLEIFGPAGLSFKVLQITDFFFKLHSGSVLHYVFIMVLSFCVLFTLGLTFKLLTMLCVVILLLKL